MVVNDPAVLAEVQVAFDAYEAALVANDVDRGLLVLGRRAHDALHLRRRPARRRGHLRLGGRPCGRRRRARSSIS
jgi:hypothetical protein